jgi:hypothetical protein
MPARIRNSHTYPQARSVTAISGRPEWVKLSPLYKRVLALAFAELKPLELRNAIRSAQSLNGEFQESDVEPLAVAMLADPNVRAVVDLFLKPVAVGEVTRVS